MKQKNVVQDRRRNRLERSVPTSKKRKTISIDTDSDSDDENKTKSEQKSVLKYWKISFYYFINI